MTVLGHFSQKKTSLLLVFKKEKTYYLSLFDKLTPVLLCVGPLIVLKCMVKEAKNVSEDSRRYMRYIKILNL